MRSVQIFLGISFYAHGGKPTPLPLPPVTLATCCRSRKYRKRSGMAFTPDDVNPTVTFQGEGVTFLYMQPDQNEPYILECPILITFFLPGPDNPFSFLIPPVEEHVETPSPDNPFSLLSSLVLIAFKRCKPLLQAIKVRESLDWLGWVGSGFKSSNFDTPYEYHRVYSEDKYQSGDPNDPNKPVCNTNNGRYTSCVPQKAPPKCTDPYSRDCQPSSPAPPPPCNPYKRNCR
ncbi:hypothetical protein Fmac_017398 [Flemingia macrophylla]|uniref:Uncharacterized protein n=1 Tax=Flemingia macrophylla TaxID=520843 RepID=A0ABD1M204_9FABA